MNRASFLLPPSGRALLPPAIVAAVATGAATGAIAAWDGRAAEAARPAILWAAVVAPDAAARDAALAAIAARAAAAGATVRSIDRASVRQALGPASPDALPLPDLVELRLPPGAPAAPLTARLTQLPAVQVTDADRTPTRPDPLGPIAALLLATLALLAAAGAGHAALTARSEALQLLAWLGTPPPRWLGEALAPAALAGTAGALAGACLAAALPWAGGGAAGRALVIAPLLVLAAMLAGATGALLRLRETLP